MRLHRGVSVPSVFFLCALCVRSFFFLATPPSGGPLTCPEISRRATCSFRRPQLTQPRKHLLRRLLPDRTSVVKDHLRRFRRLHLPVPARHHHPGHLLRVMLIHLAPKRLQIKRASVAFFRSVLATRHSPLATSVGHTRPHQSLQPNIKTLPHIPHFTTRISLLTFDQAPINVVD